MRTPTLVLATLATVTACKKTVDTKEFAANIKQRVQDMGLEPGDVTCLKGVEAKVGAVFECAVEIAGAKYDLQVTVTAVDNETKKVNMDTAWKRGRAVITSKLTGLLPGQLGEQLGTKVAVDCGAEPLLFLDAEQQASCKLTAGDVSSTVKITFDDKYAPTDWKLEPALLGRAKLEAILTPSVREKTGAEVKIDCGPNDLLARPDDGVVWCAVSDGTQQAKLRVTVSPTLDVTGWEIPKSGAPQ